MLGGPLIVIPGYSNVSYHMITGINKGDHSRTGVTSMIYKHSSWPPIWNGLRWDGPRHGYLYTQDILAY